MKAGRRWRAVQESRRQMRSDVRGVFSVLLGKCSRWHQARWDWCGRSEEYRCELRYVWTEAGNLSASLLARWDARAKFG